MGRSKSQEKKTPRRYRRDKSESRCRLVRGALRSRQEYKWTLIVHVSTTRAANVAEKKEYRGSEKKEYREVGAVAAGEVGPCYDFSPVVYRGCGVLSSVEGERDVFFCSLSSYLGDGNMGPSRV
jgi:hypothetical protein